MDDALLLRTADRNLRRKFANDLPGLTAFADGIASETQATAVTITSSGMEGAPVMGQVTMPREIWLSAAESLLADPGFNPTGPGRRARMLTPDYTFAQAV